MFDPSWLWSTQEGQSYLAVVLIGVGALGLIAVYTRNRNAGKQGPEASPDDGTRTSGPRGSDGSREAPPSGPVQKLEDLPPLEVPFVSQAYGRLTVRYRAIGFGFQANGHADHAQDTVPEGAGRQQSRLDPAPLAAPVPQVTIWAWCTKCRLKTPMRGATPTTLRNGAPAAKGTCDVCGTTVFRIGKIEGPRGVRFEPTPARVVGSVIPANDDRMVDK